MTGGLAYPSAGGLGGAGGGAKPPKPGSVTGLLLLQHMETQCICVSLLNKLELQNLKFFVLDPPV